MEIHNIDGKWYVYVAADDGDNRNRRMFVLENIAKNPFEGEFTVKTKLKTDKNDNWAIVGSIFPHNDQLCFIWPVGKNRKITAKGKPRTSILQKCQIHGRFLPTGCC